MQPTEDDVSEALELADWTLRYERPDLFIRVDEIKAQPGWEPFREQGTMGSKSGPRIIECRWCGDFMPNYGSITCTPTCSTSYRDWKEARAMRRRIQA